MQSRLLSSSVSGQHQSFSDLEPVIVEEDELVSADVLDALVAAAAEFVDDARRLRLAVMSAPVDRQNGYPHRVPGNRVEDLLQYLKTRK